MNIVDFEYFKFTGKRSGIEIFAMKNELAGVLIDYIKDYWYLLIIWAFLVWLSIHLYALTDNSFSFEGNKKTNGLKHILVEIAVMFIAIGFCILGVRGGFQNTPINTFDAARFTRPQLVALTINTPFQMLMSLQQSGLEPKNYLSEETANKLFNPINKTEVDSLNKILDKPNIVLIIVESLGKEYVGFYNKGYGYTKFLDSLLTKSMVFNHAYANSKRSIEAIPAIMASMPSLMNVDYVSSYYQSNTLNGTGSFMDKMGYDVSFYHGGKNGTMSINNFIAITGGGKYFGMDEYPNKTDFDGKWGIFDEPYLQYYSDELGKKNRPFFSSVFTLSSHHPYQVPKSMKYKFPEGTLPIHKSIKYADYALKQFFEKVSKSEWFDNTIFIITADHTAESENPHYSTPQGKFEIPLLVYFKGIKPQIIEQTTQQLDILPMIVNMANYKDDFFSFGSIGIRGISGAAIQFHDGYYQIIHWPLVYQFDGKKALGLFDLSSDELMKNNLLDKGYSGSELSSLDSTLKSLIQQYNNRLISNKTVVE